MNTSLVIQILTTAALITLLLTTGLRLTFAQIGGALRHRRMLAGVLVVNFLIVPALTLWAVQAFALPLDVGAGMMILAAAPFAPVVPIFAAMCRADLPLAASLTGLFPVFSAFLTPLVCQAGLHALRRGGGPGVNPVMLLLVLGATITLPLLIGLVIGRLLPSLTRRILRPVGLTAEAIGAISLVFVTVAEFRHLFANGWKAPLVMALLFEACLWIGYMAGVGTAQARRVVGLGTANRNIALGLLIAAGRFTSTPVLGAVVSNGLLMICLGLLQTGWWRLRQPRRFER